MAILFDMVAKKKLYWPFKTSRRQRSVWVLCEPVVKCLCICMTLCRQSLLACVPSIKCYDNHLSTLPLPYAALKQRPLTFETGAEKKALIGVPVLLQARYSMESRGFGGPLINLSAMITTYIRGEYIRGGSRPPFFLPCTSEGPRWSAPCPREPRYVNGEATN